MRPSCRWCRLLGFCISALVHLTVGAAILRNYDAENASTESLQEVAVTLAMFEAEPVPDSLALEQERESEPALEQIADSKPEPEPELQPEAKPEPVAEPEPEPETKPLPKPEPEAKPKPKPKPRAQPKRTERPKPKPTHRTRPATRSKSKHNGKTKETAAANSPAGTAKGGGKTSRARDAMEKKYLAGLRRAIARKRRYPTSARRAGKSGVATVYFILDQQGRISGARLDKSSGSKALDQAAVETLRRLARYKPIPKALGRTRWQLRVPIRFALK